jgi:hypothetical protein
MNSHGPSADWDAEQYGIATDVELLTYLATLSHVPAAPHTTWRAATVTLFATNPPGVASGYLQHVQDLGWAVPEKVLLEHAAHLLRHRAEDIDPR